MKNNLIMLVKMKQTINIPTIYIPPIKRPDNIRPPGMSISLTMSDVNSAKDESPVIMFSFLSFIIVFD